MRRLRFSGGRGQFWPSQLQADRGRESYIGIAVSPLIFEDGVGLPARRVHCILLDLARCPVICQRPLFQSILPDGCNSLAARNPLLMNGSEDLQAAVRLHHHLLLAFGCRVREDNLTWI